MIDVDILQSRSRIIEPIGQNLHVGPFARLFLHALLAPEAHGGHLVSVFYWKIVFIFLLIFILPAGPGRCIFTPGFGVEIHPTLETFLFESIIIQHQSYALIYYKYHVNTLLSRPRPHYFAFFIFFNLVKNLDFSVTRKVN